MSLVVYLFSLALLVYGWKAKRPRVFICGAVIWVFLVWMLGKELKETIEYQRIERVRIKHDN